METGRRSSINLKTWIVCAAGALLFLVQGVQGQDTTGLSKIAPEVLTKEQRSEASGMIGRDIQRRTAAFNTQNREEWYRIKSREQWEKYSDERIERLRRSLGSFPKPGKLNVHVTGVIKGDGFNIQNVAYESLPGNWVVGNLYVPATPSKAMPGILIAHAHHRGKTQSELQDMGMTWARAGCMVLVIDQVGYGERSSHPFRRDEDYPKPFKTSRQDYYFRYDTGVQLQLLGDSLMGWMAWDLMRGVDLLLARDGIDPKRIIILGAVAGGGDPAGVTAALDERITCCVPFNFGGPQPETKYPLPEDAETSFNYLLFTYWDSTRGLRLGASDDFPHWVIVASMAPRYLIHGHEFSWDGERDPVWKRYQKVWGDFYGAADHVGVAHGKGILKLRPPEASHCTNIGEFHRRMIHPLFDKWFGIKVTAKDEFSAPVTSESLRCFTATAQKAIQPKTLNEAMSDIGRARVEAARKLLDGKDAAAARAILRERWSKLLGPVDAKAASVVSQSTDEPGIAGARVERIVLESEPGFVIPVLVLKPVKSAKQSPVVVGLAGSGKMGFLKERSAEVQKLLQAGAIVVLPDLRGTGETRSGSSRGRDSSDTDHSVHLQVFGETLLGGRLRDLRSLLGYLRARPDVDDKQVVLWGDSFTPPNPSGTNFKIPHAVDGWPTHSEPLGGLLALLGALYDDNVRAVYIAGGLSSYHSVLGHFAVLIPHGDALPGALTAGDLSDLAGSLSPRPLRLESMVDNRNQLVPLGELQKTYAHAIQQYSSVPGALSFGEARSPAADWILGKLK